MLISNLPELELILAKGHFYYLLWIRKACQLERGACSGKIPLPAAAAELGWTAVSTAEHRVDFSLPSPFQTHSLVQAQHVWRPGLWYQHLCRSNHVLMLLILLVSKNKPWHLQPSLTYILIQVINSYGRKLQLTNFPRYKYFNSKLCLSYFYSVL